MVAGGAEADAVRGLHHLEPLRGVDLVGAELGADLVVEDLGGGAGQRAEAGLLEAAQEGLERHAERRRALPDLERREGVHVHVGGRFLHRAAEVEIGLPGVVGVDAALHADFGRAALPGFDHAPLHLVEPEVVRLAAQVLGELALGEGAELAAEVADVGVVDVAVDDVGHDVAARLAPQRVGGVHHRLEVVAAGAEERRHFVFGEVVAAAGAVEDRRRSPFARTRAERRAAPRATALEIDRRRLENHARRPGLDPRQAVGVHHLEHARPDRVVEPGPSVERVARIDRSAVPAAACRRARSPRPAARGAARALRG